MSLQDMGNERLAFVTIIGDPRSVAAELAIHSIHSSVRNTSIQV